MRQLIIFFFLLSLLLTGGNLEAQTINMRVPDTTVVSGNNIDIPVYADNSLTGYNILSYTLQLTFDQNLLQVVSVITTGTLSAPFGSPAVNTSVPGVVTIANAGTAPLSGIGKFIYIRFKARQPGGMYISFTNAQNNYFNEGTPAMIFHNGYLNITSPPSINISPNNGLISKGETLQFYQSGGTAPFQWYVTNSSIASINTSGLLTATNYGLTKVVVVDHNGLRDTTNSFIDIRAMRLSIPTNLSQWQGSDIDVPINTTDLTGLNVLSGNFTINFNSNILTPSIVVQAGTMLATYPAPVMNTGIPGTVSVAFAGNTPLTGSGTLIYVRFHVSTQNAGGTAINFTSALFNEIFVPTITDGYFTTINLPVLSITPYTGSLIAGQSQLFTVNGGATPPLTWSVNDPTIASISPAGVVNAIKGGTLVVSVVDAHGATASSGAWTLYDTQITMPEPSTCPAAGVFYYPVLINALPAGESIYSIQAKITYNSTLLTFQQVEPTGTLSQGWTFVSNPSTGSVIVAGSGTTPFNTTGTIFYLKFGLNAGFVNGSSASLQLLNVLLNQGSPSPWVDVNGSITGVNSGTASVSITANPPGTICAGTVVVFTALPVNGGSPTYQWKKNGSVIPGETNATFTSSTLSNADIITCVLTPSGTCASSSPVTSNAITMALNPLPSAAGSVSGPASVPFGQAGIGYSISAVPNATSYFWTVPGGWTITSGQGSTSIVVSAGNNNGNIQVTPLNSCGNGNSSLLAVTVTGGTKTLNLSVMLEGLYNTSTSLMNQAQNSTGNQFPGLVADKITVEIRQNSSPYTLVQSFGNINLLTNGSSTLSVPVIYSGSYYIVIRHRNSIETWSGLPVSFSPGTVNYNFSNAATQAFGNNLKQVGSIYLIYGGDANQDGVVDGSDMAAIDNASTMLLSGYNSEDINGDGIVDGSDMAIIDNNSTAIIQAQKP
ncbi:MAG: Ig-like domain-containing protein [Bacteroidetes bacterium]|nr:Ig-like domain-containing protein [Bacteroidota bacterium]